MSSVCIYYSTSVRNIYRKSKCKEAGKDIVKLTNLGLQKQNWDTNGNLNFPNTILLGFSGSMEASTINCPNMLKKILSLSSFSLFWWFVFFAVVENNYCIHNKLPFTFLMHGHIRQTKFPFKLMYVHNVHQLARDLSQGRSSFSSNEIPKHRKACKLKQAMFLWHRNKK